MDARIIKLPTHFLPINNCEIRIPRKTKCTVVNATRWIVCFFYISECAISIEGNSMLY
jgi:hypothetical protein